MRPELTCPACDARLIWPTDLGDAEMHCPRCHASIPNPATSIQEEPALPPARVEPESAIIGTSQVGNQNPEEAGLFLLIVLIVVLIVIVLGAVLIWYNLDLSGLRNIG